MGGAKGGAKREEMGQVNERCERRGGRAEQQERGGKGERREETCERHILGQGLLVYTHGGIQRFSEVHHISKVAPLTTI